MGYVEHRMKFAVIAIFVEAFGVASALSYVGAYQTGRVALDPYGWSPQPTPAPYYHLHRRRLQQRDLTSTCAYVNAVGIGCSSGEYCAYNSGLHFMGCCSVNSNGQFDNDCYYTTSCVDIAESSSICGTDSGCLDVQTGVCGSDTDYPECLTIVLYYGAFDSYTTFRCGSAAEFLSASVPIPGPSTTAPSSTPVTTTPISSNSTSASPSTTSMPSSSPPPIPTPAPNHTGAIVGGTVGGVAGLALIGGIIGFIAYRIRVKKREAEYGDDEPEMPGTAHTSK